MSKSFCLCSAGLVLGLVLQGCGDSTSSTTTPASIVSSTNGLSTTGASTTGASTTGTNTTGTSTTGTTIPFTGTTTQGPPVPPTYVPHSAITFAGRWYTEDGRKKTSWGQSVVTQFSKSTRVSITMHGQVGSFFSYRVDDGEWTKIQGVDGSMQLASGLDPNSEHTVRFGKSNEPQDYGIFDFDHLELDEGFTAAQPPRKLVYQAIGDSITAGYRALCPSMNDGGDSCGSTAETENGYSTYVRHLAEAWGTDEWSSVAVSGVGVGVVMPRKILDYYKCREFFNWGDCEHPFDFSTEHRKPDVITVNIGTNDYALSPTGPPSNEEFQSNYVELVSFLQETYPDATIFCINPLQYTVAGTPPGQTPNMWTDLHNNVKAAVDTIASDKVIHVSTGDPTDAALHQGSDYSDNTHPTADGHAKFATFLEAAMTPVIRQNHPGLLPPAEQAQAVIA